MDLHRLRVVEFDTSVREKEREKKNVVEHEECKREDRKSSTVGNRDQIGDENQCINDNTSLPGLSKICGEEISPPGTLKKYLSDTSVPSGTSIKICVNNETTPPRTTEQCPGYKLCSPRTSKKSLNDTTSTSHLRTSKNQRSKSEIFQIPPRKKPRKRALKINSSDIGLTKLFQNSANSHQKKRMFNLPNRNINERVHHKEENKKEKKSEEVHFLFARETPSFIRYRGKRAENNRTKNTHGSKLTNDIYGFRKSNGSIYQHQYQMSFFNFLDTDKLPFKKRRVGFCRKPKRPVTNCYCKHHAMRVLNSTYDNVGSRPIYYTLGTHPHPRKSPQKRDCDKEALKRERSYCKAKDKTVEVSPSLFSPECKSLHDAGTGPSKVELPAGFYHRPPSVHEKSTTIQNFTVANEYNQKPCLLSRAPSPCAANTAPSQRPPCELKKSQTLTDVTRTSEGNQKPSPMSSSPSPCALCAARTAPVQRKCKKKHKKTKKSFYILTLCNGYLSRLSKLVTDFYLKHDISGKNCIKYVFFGLLIVVWSPCLLAVILAWVVMFPWKLTNILKTDVSKRSFPINYSFKNRLRKNNVRREYQQMCFENYLPEKKRSFTTLATSLLSRTVGGIVNTFNAAISLLKLKKKAPMGAGSSFLPSPHPNPRKRYKLFYADNRGWVLKPLRCRRQSCASNRVLQSMRCEYRPKFSRSQNLRVTSLKKVPCPEQKTCGNLRCQYSPAGDAYTVQCRNSYVYWDAYSQRPSLEMPLKSQHHQRQLKDYKVNIPPTFSYQMPGITSISTDEMVITNSNIFNLNEIKNNTSHIYLAKDCRGQRSNETFGIVLNDPCGAKPPLSSNFETCRPHKFGLSGKTFSKSTKCSPRILLKGLQGQFPKCWTKHNVGNALLKAPRVHRITTSKDNTNSMPSCKLNKLQLRGNQTITNKKSRSIPQKDINFRNKSIFTDYQSALTKQANTSTHQVNNAHKTQNTSKQKVRNKSKTEKTKPDMASKYACDVKRFSPKQENKYKTQSRVLNQKHPSTDKTKSRIKQDITLNYSFENKRKQFKQSYKYKPDLIPIATQTLLNTADIMTMTNRDVGLNCSCGKTHEQFKYCYKPKAHQTSIATQKQLCTADITTSTNRNVALNYSREENHGLSKHGHKRKPNKISVATQMKSRTADITTGTNRNVASNCPCEVKHKLPNQGHKRKPNKIPVATQKQSRTADITTSTNCNVASNGPCEVKHKLPHHVYTHKLQHTLVASHMQSRTIENATDTYQDPALNGNYVEKHELTHRSYNHKPYKISVATQKQSRTAENATDTNQDLTLNYTCVEKHGLSQRGYKRKPHKIPVATQKQSRTTDNATDTNPDVTLNYPSGIKPSTANKETLCIASTANKETEYIQEFNLSESVYKYIPDQISISTQKQLNTVDITTMTNRNIALNYPSKQKQFEQTYKYKQDHIPFATQKQPSAADILTSTKYLSGVTPSIPNKDILHSCISSTTGKDTACTQKNIAPENLPKNHDISIQKQSYKIDASILINCVGDYKISKTKEVLRPEQMQSPDCTDTNTSWEKTTQQTQNASFKKVIDWSWGGRLKGSRKIQGPRLYKDTQTIAFSVLKDEIKPELPKRVISEEMVDCDCGTLRPTETAAEFPMERQADENICARYPSKTPPSPKSSFVGETLEISRLSTTQPLSTRQDQTTDLLQQFQLHANSSLFGIASDSRLSQVTQVSNLQGNNQELKISLNCRCREYPQQDEPDKEFKQKEDNSKNTYTHKTSSAKEPKLTKVPSHTLQEEPKLFGIASDCVCGTNQQIVAKRRLDKYISIKQTKVPKTLHPHDTETTPSTNIQKLLSDSGTAHPCKTRNSSQFGIASDCRCGESQQNEVDKELRQKKDNSKKNYIRQTVSAKELPSKHTNVTQAPSHILQEQSKSFRIASDCTCGTNQPTVAKQSSYNKVSNSKLTTTKETKSKSPEHLPLPKSLPRKSELRKCQCRSLLRKCRCPVESVQMFEDEQCYGSKESLISSERNIIKVNKPRSQFLKSPDRSRPLKFLPSKCRCLVESPQDSVGKQPYGTKLSTLSSNRPKFPKSSEETCPCPVQSLQESFPKKIADSKVNETFYKRNNVKVDENRPKLQKSSEHAITPLQKYLHHDCTCQVKNLQDPVDKKTSNRFRKSFFSRKSKRNSIDIPNDCPCVFSQNYSNKISFISDVPVNWQNANQALIRSYGRTECTCSVDKPSFRVQSSRISQCSSKVSSLVMSLLSKLFNRSVKSNQVKIFKNPTKIPLSVIISSLQVKPKKVDKTDISINDILESILDDESNQSPFRQSHKTKTLQNPSLPLHSSHSICSSVLDESPSRQYMKKNQAKTFQRPSFLLHSSKYERPSQSIKIDQRVSQSIISQQSNNTESSEHSSIVTLFTRKSRSKLQSTQLQSSQKFDPQYSSSLMNHRPTLTAKQVKLQQLPPVHKTRKSKRSSLFNRPESKLLADKIRSITDKLSTDSCKNKREKKSCTSSVDTALIYSSACWSQKLNQLPKTHQSLEKISIPQPEVSGQSRQFKLMQHLPSAPLNNINSPPLRTEKQSEFCQYLENQAFKSIASKSSQRHSSQTCTPHSAHLRYYQRIRKKPCKCRSFKHGNEQLPNGLHKIAKKRMSHQSTDKIKNSHLISHVCSCSSTTKQMGEHNITVQQSEISQSPEIQSNLQFQIYQQNLPDQKRMLQIPTNADKPSPELLQQCSDGPGYVQKSTAEGKVRQSYPDFNRVSLRYPGLNKSPPKPTLQIPGVLRPPTNNYPPAPGATPPPNYASDPCCTNLPCDESALRRAYKRRPLRYTPPRQQLPRVVMIKKLKENKQKCAEAKRKKEKQSFFQCLRHLVTKTEREVWPTDVKCNPMWLNAMKRTPCLCVYKVCPRMYPTFLNCCKNSRNICQLFVYFLTLCFWSPLLFCVYLCCNAMCKCCS